MFHFQLVKRTKGVPVESPLLLALPPKMPIVTQIYVKVNGTKTESIRIRPNHTIQEVKSVLCAAAEISDKGSATTDAILKLYNSKKNLIPIGPNIPKNSVDEPYELLVKLGKEPSLPDPLFVSSRCSFTMIRNSRKSNKGNYYSAEASRIPQNDGRDTCRNKEAHGYDQSYNGRYGGDPAKVRTYCGRCHIVQFKCSFFENTARD
ncbi:hypothetical protein BC830DRAFT_1147198, partial [Chytriomyces sp. MP71]